MTFFCNTVHIILTELYHLKNFLYWDDKIERHFVLYVVWVFFLSVLYVAGLRDSRESGSVDPSHQSGRILISFLIHTTIKNL